jgi:3-methyl-2-oxobutanoate hydroxymethyltransferase
MNGLWFSLVQDLCWRMILTDTIASLESRISTASIGSRKNTTPIVALTAYTTPMAQRLDPHVDLLLVGDSLAMVIYGMDTTVGISLDTMIAHGQAVMRGSKQACVIIDLPAGSYEENPEQAVRSAKRVMAETQAQGVKLEGGTAMAEQIEAIVKAGIPVLGHIGLLPQKVTEAGGYKIQGRDDAGYQAVIDDAWAVTDAGAFAVVIEGTVEILAREITGTLPIPTIGIGASPACDGQILVSDDMLGLYSDFTPKFVKRFGDIGKNVEQAARDYAAEVRSRHFPEVSHVYQLDQNVKAAS